MNSVTTEGRAKSSRWVEQAPQVFSVEAGLVQALDGSRGKETGDWDMPGCGNGATKTQDGEAQRAITCQGGSLLWWQPW